MTYIKQYFGRYRIMLGKDTRGTQKENALRNKYTIFWQNKN